MCDILSRMPDKLSPLHIPSSPDLSAGIYFRHLELKPEKWGMHSHPWGQWNYLTHGVMNMLVDGASFLSPSHYAIWIPPNVGHSSVNLTKATYRAAYLSSTFCRKMPRRPCALSISPMLRVILDEFARIAVRSPRTRAQRTMAQVALDQITAASPFPGYLPSPTSDFIREVMAAISKDLSVRRSTSELAASFYVTQRTLERRCLKEIGIGLGEWQQRIRFMHAVEALSEGLPVKRIATDLGYSTSSAFIAMFREISGGGGGGRARSR
jgi:AraC-like DNA-binding protein